MKNTLVLFGLELNPFRAVALLALGAFTVFVPSCSASEPDRTPLALETEGATCTCPPSDSCGKYTCAVFPSGCTWTALLDKGDPCLTASNTKGHCVYVPAGRTSPEHLECCDGCASKDGCQPGTENGYCGIGGNVCDACGPCETCSDQKCVPTTGNACGTCRTCSDGACKDDDVGTSCSGGRCAAGAVCCSGCIDDNDQCVSSTDATCGTNGARCVSCGQCGTCSNGGCSPRDSGTCNDDNPCTSGDTCSSGACTGTPVSVDDGNPCTDDACTAETGVTHTSVPEGTMCPDDGSSCTSGERCTDHDMDALTPRVCLPATGTTCEVDGNPCTSDAPDCNNGTCPFAPLDQQPCTTGNRCVLNELCQGDTCTGEPRNCSDDNPCTTDSCHPEDGEGIDPVTGCLHTPKKTSVTCDDSNECTTDDHCGADGTCAGSAVVCEALDNCHAPGTCDPGAGECTDPRLQDGTQCGRTGLCDKGVCKGDTPAPTTGGTGGTSAGGAPGEAGATSAGTTNSSTGGTGARGGTTGAGGTGAPEGGTAGEMPTSTGGTTSGGTSGRGGTSSTAGSGGDTTGEGAAASGELYQRDPGGCSCNVPVERKSKNLAWVTALVGVLALRRRRTPVLARR